MLVKGGPRRIMKVTVLFYEALLPVGLKLNTNPLVCRVNNRNQGTVPIQHNNDNVLFPNSYSGHSIARPWGQMLIQFLMLSWASYQIRKIVGCACTGNAGNIFFADFKGSGMHHCACLTHVGIANPLRRGKRSRHSRPVYNRQFYVSGMRPIAVLYVISW